MRQLHFFSVRRLERIEFYIEIVKHTKRFLEHSAEKLKFDDELNISLEKLYVYAKMRKDEDCSVDKYVQMVDRVKNLLVEISEKTAYIMPELSANSQEFLQSLASDKDMRRTYS